MKNSYILTLLAVGLLMAAMESLLPPMYYAMTVTCNLLVPTPFPGASVL